MALDYKPEPTIRPFPDFSAAEDGTALREAMKGFGTNEDAIVEILTNRSNSQRQEIAKFFTEEYGRNIIEDLKSELGGHFEDLIVALMIPPVDYLCKQLHKAMSGLGTNDHCLVEILCSHSKKEIQNIVDAYERLYDRPLAEHMCSETSGDFRRLLTLIVTVKDDQPPNRERAAIAAQEIIDAGEGKLGTDEEIFNKIFAHECFPQLKLIFEEYKNIGGRTIEQAIKNELSGSLKEAMLAIVECVQHPPTFFAKRLHSAMAGMGTDDTTLIRIIVSRSEIDLENIKLEYERLYEKTLESAVREKVKVDSRFSFPKFQDVYEEDYAKKLLAPGTEWKETTLKKNRERSEGIERIPTVGTSGVNVYTTVRIERSIAWPNPCNEAEALRGVTRQERAQ